MSKRSFGLGIALGALTGAALAYLFAPQSGEEFQSDMKDKMRDMKNKAVVGLDDAIIDAEIWFDRKMAHEDQVEPIRYEEHPDHVAPAPPYTESPDVFIEE